MNHSGQSIALVLITKPTTSNRSKHQNYQLRSTNRKRTGFS